MGRVHPYDMTVPVIELDCDACGARRRMDRMDVIRASASYIAPDVALFMLAQGCEGRSGECGLRFTNVPGATQARSVINRKGAGWTRRRDREENGWVVLWDGWSVGQVSVVPHGPSKGLWRWNTGTHPPRTATVDDEADALAAIKLAVVFGADGLPDTTCVWKVRRAALGWPAGIRSGPLSKGDTA